MACFPIKSSRQQLWVDGEEEGKTILDNIPGQCFHSKNIVHTEEQNITELTQHISIIYTSHGGKWPRISLNKPRESSFYTSHDGKWLRISLMNKPSASSLYTLPMVENDPELHGTNPVHHHYIHLPSWKETQNFTEQTRCIINVHTSHRGKNPELHWINTLVEHLPC